jgi:hypothetical protein
MPTLTQCVDQVLEENSLKSLPTKDYENCKTVLQLLSSAPNPPEPIPVPTGPNDVMLLGLTLVFAAAVIDRLK